MKIHRTFIASLIAGTLALVPVTTYAMGGALAAARAATVSSSSATAQAAARSTMGARLFSNQTVLGAGIIGGAAGMTTTEALGLPSAGLLSPELEKLLLDNPMALTLLRDQALQSGEFQRAAVLDELIQKANRQEAIQSNLFGRQPKTTITVRGLHSGQELSLTPNESGDADWVFKPLVRGEVVSRAESLRMLRQGEGFTATFQESCSRNDTAIAFVSRYVTDAAKALTRTVSRNGIGAEDLAQSFWLNFEALCASFEARSDKETMGLVRTVLRNNLYALIKADGRQVLAVQKKGEAITVVPAGDGTHKRGSAALDAEALAKVEADFTDEALNQVDMNRMAMSMSPDQRKALALKMSGFSLAEAGMAMGVPDTRVKQLLREARSKARAYLDAGGSL